MHCLFAGGAHLTLIRRTGDASMAQFRFIPHKADAIRTNQVMHEGLFESLEHIADVLKSEDPELSRHLKNWTRSARSGMRVPAAVIGATLLWCEELRSQS